MIHETGRLSGKRGRDEETPVLASLSTNENISRSIQRTQSNSHLSRHIPNRDGMDMVVSAYNLKSCNSTSHHSGCSSQLSEEDNDQNLSAQYRERLAGRLQSLQQKRLGGEVLSFHKDRGSQHQQVSSEAAFSSRATQAQTAQRLRVVNSNPERILDAPNIPHFQYAQSIDWGANNKLVIGIRSDLYAWDAETSNASRILELSENSLIRSVRWVPRSDYVAFTLNGSTTFCDANKQTLLRTVRTPNDLPITQVSFSSESCLFAASAASDSDQIFLFDTRKRDAHLATIENSNKLKVGPIAFSCVDSMNLAAGCTDGSVVVWDIRNPAGHKHMLPRVHHGKISSIAWNPDSRSTLFSGGIDAALNQLDIRGGELHSGHGPVRPAVLQSVNTRSPVTGIIAASGVDEIVTSHEGQTQLQLRSVSKFSSIATFSTASTSASDGISCISLAPDAQRVCAVAKDETLKFWRVFRPPQLQEEPDSTHDALR